MKKILTILLTLISITLYAHIPDELSRFALMPKPQKIETMGGQSLFWYEIKSVVSDKNTERPVLPHLLKGLPADGGGSGSVTLITDKSLSLPSTEGYILEIRDKKITIRAKSKSGHFYALQTLQQLMEDSRDQQIAIPPCRITDYPEISYRAVHLDMKHHLETGRYYYELIDRLAAVKVNAIIVEMEDKLRYRKYPVIGAKNALTVEEFAALSRYARERFIEISPLIQGLGHASFILKHEQFKSLRDDPSSDWVFDPLNPATYEVQFSLYEDAIAATPGGRYLHVGGDEVGSLGKSERSRISKMKAFELQMHWLKKVSDFAVAHNRIPIFWDDMVFKLSNLYRTTWDDKVDKESVEKLWNENQHLLNENLHLFPKNCVYMRWNYSHPAIPGNFKAMDWYAANNLKVMAATAAQTRWTLFPRNRSNFQPIKEFSQLTSGKNLEGILCTMWDDNSPHFETFWRGIYDFAYFSWNYEEHSADQVHSLFRHRFFSPKLAAASSDFQDKLEDQVTLWETLLVNKGDREDIEAQYDFIELPEKNKPGEWSQKYKNKIADARDVMDRQNQIRLAINASKTVALRNQYTLDVMEQVNELQGFVPRLILALEAFDKVPVSEKARVAKSVQTVINDFQTVRKSFEHVYSQTRILGNPPEYILDQNHHKHPANGTNNTDWMYMHEVPFLEKTNEWLKGVSKL